ncbi:uncharacterized protein BT62DRAFT_1001563 [Guyanagaster necrorhizus]|uniref:Uncharacterized protein n=1 Tax=Guyanagaster necrorhizus TaxID=856835 RepID=A0A9P7W247_9AGAR|nr:uncharacterized protein BT62DRAFT_1001563 [Guyanagaster necrorhizus MCA 3950]KAG7450777.1 hypothetical protein BT62DRAFT_1001563 [Guyanagaster necrorhizus MCA 3950]
MLQPCRIVNNSHDPNRFIECLGGNQRDTDRAKAQKKAAAAAKKPKESASSLAKRKERQASLYLAGDLDMSVQGDRHRGYASTEDYTTSEANKKTRTAAVPHRLLVAVLPYFYRHLFIQTYPSTLSHFPFPANQSILHAALTHSWPSVKSCGARDVPQVIHAKHTRRMFRTHSLIIGKQARIQLPGRRKGYPVPLRSLTPIQNAQCPHDVRKQLLLAITA